MPFGIHGPDLLIVLAIALLIFGPKKLPEMGSAIGKSIKEFQKGMKELSAPKDEKPAAYEATENIPPVHNTIVADPNLTPNPEYRTEHYTAEPTPAEVHEEPTSYSSTETNIK